jgi:hypothetical protein
MTGASETGETVTMQHLLKAWCGEHGKATTHSPLSMMAMFTAPERIGEEQVKAVLKAKPDAGHPADPGHHPLLRAIHGRG